MRALVLALALVLGGSFAARAAVVELGGNAANPVAIDAFSNPLSLNSENAIIGTITGTGVFFNHTVSFSLLVAADVGIAGDVLETKIGPKVLSDINDFTFVIRNADTNTVLATGSDDEAFLLSLLSGTNYKIEITGDTTGSVGGKYAINLAVTPVPAAALLLAPALIGLGIAASRRARA
jgi:hypothetical protein